MLCLSCSSFSHYWSISFLLASRLPIIVPFLFGTHATAAVITLHLSQSCPRIPSSAFHHTKFCFRFPEGEETRERRVSSKTQAWREQICECQADSVLTTLPRPSGGKHDPRAPVRKTCGHAASRGRTWKGAQAASTPPFGLLSLKLLELF